MTIAEKLYIYSQKKTSGIDKDIKYIKKDVTKDYLNRKKKHLFYIDILNFERGLFRHKISSNYKMIMTLRKFVDKFITRVRKLRYKIVIFCDELYSTKETFKKSTSRIIERIYDNTQTNEKFPRVKNYDAMYLSLFKRHGIKIHYSMYDNDTTLATYAFKDGANIVSNDKDFYRYNCDFDTYDIDLKSKELFVVNVKNIKEKRSKLKLFGEYPPTIESPIYSNQIYHNFSYFGDSILGKYLDNPQYLIRTLRYPIYEKYGLYDIVEWYPVYNKLNKKVHWERIKSYSDNSLKHLLEQDSPEDLLRFYGLFDMTDRLNDNYNLSKKSIENYVCCFLSLIIKEYCNWDYANRDFYEIILHWARVLSNKKENDTKISSYDIAIEFKCSVCREITSLTRGEVMFYEKKMFKLPRKCYNCRIERKVKM